MLAHEHLETDNALLTGKKVYYHYQIYVYPAVSSHSSIASRLGSVGSS
jgi:hypothetical protein